MEQQCNATFDRSLIATLNMEVYGEISMLTVWKSWVNSTSSYTSKMLKKIETLHVYGNSVQSAKAS